MPGSPGRGLHSTRLRGGPRRCRLWTSSVAALVPLTTMTPPDRPTSGASAGSAQGAGRTQGLGFDLGKSRGGGESLNPPRPGQERLVRLPSGLHSGSLEGLKRPARRGRRGRSEGRKKSQLLTFVLLLVVSSMTYGSGVVTSIRGGRLSEHFFHDKKSCEMSTPVNSKPLHLGERVDEFTIISALNLGGLVRKDGG